MTQLSKYALDYAPRSLVAAVSLAIAGAVSASRRAWIPGGGRTTHREEYVLLDARVSRRAVGRSSSYGRTGRTSRRGPDQEIAGVPMPGAAMTVSLAIGGR